MWWAIGLYIFTSVLNMVIVGMATDPNSSSYNPRLKDKSVAWIMMAGLLWPTWYISNIYKFAFYMLISIPDVMKQLTYTKEREK